jgi:hypothetical protein
MKRPLGIAFVAALLLLSIAPTLAAPLLQEQRPMLAQPEPDAAVRGVVQMVGTATHPQFQRYELYYAPWPVPSDQSWIFIGDAHFQQQPLGLLGTWDSRSVPDGAYGLRVRVVKQDGNYIDGEPRRVLVVNTRPLEPPTPTEAPAVAVEATNTPPPTALPATPTIVVDVPIVPTVAPEPTETPAAEPGGVAAAPSQPTPSAGLEQVDDFLDFGRLRDVAVRAALYTGGAFAAVGLFFGVKGLLSWLWLKIRP